MPLTRLLNDSFRHLKAELRPVILIMGEVIIKKQATESPAALLAMIEQAADLAGSILMRLVTSFPFCL